jgi:arginyl-tRNA synthetase
MMWGSVFKIREKRIVFIRYMTTIIKAHDMEKDILALLKKSGVEAKEEMLERPPKPELGDYAFPCFGLAKEKKKAPNLIAKDIVDYLTSKKLVPKGEVKEVRQIGGYVNFFLDWGAIAEDMVGGILKQDEKFGRPAKLKAKEKIMVEYSQPNPVHSMHIGHARGTFLGDGLANIFSFQGHDVIRANYMNDCGLQVAKLVTAYQLWGEGKELPKEGEGEKPDVWLWRFYVRFHEEAEKDPTLEEKARENLRLIDVVKDPAALELRDKIVGWCVQGFEQTYSTVGIKFDDYLYESKFRDEGKKVVEAALKKGLAFESEEKTIVADLQKHAGMPGFVILRSDGTGLYQTSDLGATIYKFKHYKLDKAIWVVSSQQNLYFSQVKKLFELLGYKWEKNAIHYSFDLVRLPEGTMSSRKGKAVLLDDVIEKLTGMAYDEVSKRNPDSEEDIKRHAAAAIGIGALKYAIEKIQPEQGITFDFEKMLAFEGNTGPYLQYAHTRCASILSKAGLEMDAVKKMKIAKPLAVAKEEAELVKLLADFPKVVETAASEMHINDICNYAFSVATAFSSFYQACPVLKAESEEQKAFRLKVVVATKIVLRNALRILGMEPIERM